MRDALVATIDDRVLRQRRAETCALALVRPALTDREEVSIQEDGTDCGNLDLVLDVDLDQTLDIDGDVEVDPIVDLAPRPS